MLDLFTPADATAIGAVATVAKGMTKSNPHLATAIVIIAIAAAVYTTRKLNTKS